MEKKFYCKAEEALNAFMQERDNDFNSLSDEDKKQVVALQGDAIAELQGLLAETESSLECLSGIKEQLENLKHAHHQMDEQFERFKNERESLLHDCRVFKERIQRNIGVFEVIHEVASASDASYAIAEAAITANEFPGDHLRHYSNKN